MGQRLPIIRSFSRLLLTAAALCLVSASLVSTNSANSAIDLQGRPLDPFRAARGKVVVLIFVRTDCPISNRYAPVLQHISAQYRGAASFFLVYPSKRETADLIRKHDQQFGFGARFTALRDPQHILVKQSQAQTTPETAVFDANQQLVYHGRIDNLYEDFSHSRRTATTHELADAIEAATAGKSAGGKSAAAKSTPAVGCYISDLE